MFRVFFIAFFLALSVPALAQKTEALDGVTDEVPAEDSGQWFWSVTPYIWALDTDADLTVDDNPAGGGKFTYSDLHDTLDVALQLVAEAGKKGGNWSAFIDLTYMEASDDSTVSGVGADVFIESDSTHIYIDAAAAYWPLGVDENFSLFGGIRYTDIDDDFDLSEANAGTPIGLIANSSDFTDVLLGGRYTFDVAPRWSILTKADYSFGDSDGIWQVEAMVRYAVGSQLQNGIIVGYRYKEAELEEGGIKEDYEYRGPAVAFNFRF